eukprot:762576-Hanusia_phi.AAC.2
MSWSLVESTGSSPSPRAFAALLAFSDKLFLIAGMDTFAGAWSKELYKLHPSNLSWSLVTQQGVYPPMAGIAQHGMSSVRESIYVFGGMIAGQGRVLLSWTAAGCSAQMLKFNASSELWEFLSPRPRSGHTSAVVGERMYVYGGIFNNTVWPLNEMLVLHLDSFKWSFVDIRPRYGTVGHAMVAMEDFIFIHGGCLYLISRLPRTEQCPYKTDQLLAFDTISSKWYSVSPAMTSMKQFIYVFGGLTDNASMTWVGAAATAVEAILPRFNFAMAPALDRIVVCGGYADTGHELACVHKA